MKLVVTGTRGIPDIMAGVETHCEELLQGDISVESEMGRGSRFTVILPFERQAVN